jgi:DNA-binding transcriptional LysR family regulator
MALTFRRLQVFVAAAHDCNFRRTADRLGISQPSISAQIREVETLLGYELFERRRGTSSTLSDAGQEFLVRARELLKAEGELDAERRGSRRAQVAILKVSAGPILLETRVKPRLPEFHERNPNIALEFLPFNPSSDGEKALRSGAIDVLLYTGGPPQKASTRSDIIAQVSCSIYSSSQRDEQLATRKANLSAAPFVMPPKHYRISQWFETQLASMGVRPRNIVARPPYMEVVRQMTVDGKGLSVLFDEHAAEHVESGKLHAVSADTIWAFRVMMLGRRALRPEMAPALQFLREVARG